jgi:hypothetical protein
MDIRQRVACARQMAIQGTGRKERLPEHAAHHSPTTERLCRPPLRKHQDRVHRASPNACSRHVCGRSMTLSRLLEADLHSPTLGPAAKLWSPERQTSAGILKQQPIRG